MFNDYFVIDSTSPSGLRWKVSPKGGVCAGAPVGKQMLKRYWQTKLKQKYYLVHRVIWEMVHGPIPDGCEIDHKDTDPANNAVSNLRLASRTANCQNRSKQSNNRSGYKGVCWNKGKNKWHAQIWDNGKKVHVGYFTDVLVAAAAYAKAAEQYHGTFARTN